MPPFETLRAAIRRDHRIAEAEAVSRLRALQPDPGASQAITRAATDLATRVRKTPAAPLSAESFLRQYGLSSREGIALMCVAEALLRIPDPETADALLRDKLSQGNWESEAQGSLLASAADWGLMLTGTLARWHDLPGDSFTAQMKQLAARLGEPVVRTAVRHAMRILAGQFVLAETIEEATRRAGERRPYRFSFDMLGEAARTAEDAARYFASYVHSVKTARSPDTVSIKLSALHPRFEEAKRGRVLSELLPRLRELAAIAAHGHVVLTVDAEESERLELTLDLYESLTRDFEIGLAVQAYQRRALAVCDWLAALGRTRHRRLPIRLVKGAYWDGEVKRAQQLGMPDYPIFTRKALTDISYVACARRLLEAPDAIYPAFATHNCTTVAAILGLCPPDKGGTGGFEFLKLFGMGDALYDALLAELPGTAVRVYAPVGSFTDLLPYLVRRLLENGANTSFVHQIADPSVPIEQLVADPVAQLPEPYQPDPRIPFPRELYPDRKNSLGLDLSRRDVLDSLEQKILYGWTLPQAPATSPGDLEAAIARANAAFEGWSRTPAAERAGVLERTADQLEERMYELVSLIVREGGRTYADAASEVREAADFCRYYALQARRNFEQPQPLPGPAGERNELALGGRGVFACISPWNFPLAIFTGQIAAALAAGNTVLAKPAEQTPRIALQAVKILEQAGLEKNIAQCVVGDGETIGAALVADPRIAGIAFTGSVETAKRINQTLAARDGPIIPLIAETGGVNAMIVDASALPEQVVDDVVVSAFQSAGQRCSAQRILFVDAGCAPPVTALLRGALAELKVGDPAEPDTDIGPVIDASAMQSHLEHIARLRQSATLIGEAPRGPGLKGNFIAPIAFSMPLSALPRTEVFGPILHVCAFERRELPEILPRRRETPYGLTSAVHSRT